MEKALVSQKVVDIVNHFKENSTFLSLQLESDRYPLIQWVEEADLMKVWLGHYEIKENDLEEEHVPKRERLSIPLNVSFVQGDKIQ